MVGSLWLGVLGCAYPLAVHKGERAAARGDWATAYDAYTAAVDRRPGEAEAEQGRATARDHLVEAAIAEARTAMGSGQFEASLAAIGTAEGLDSDRPEVYQLRLELERAVAGEVSRLWETGDARGSYAMAVRARKMFPKAAYLGPTFDQLRTHFAGRAEALLKEKKFEYALVAVRTISEFEPDQQLRVAPIEGRVLTAWADDCAGRAAVHARGGRVGASAVLYARAHEIAGRAEDLVKARAAAASLASGARFSVAVAVTGPGDRAAELRQAVLAAVGKTPSAEIVAAGGDLGVKLVVGAPRCVDSDSPTKTSVQYVSGQTSKPNPVHAAITAERAAATAEEAAASATLAKVAPKLTVATEAMAKFDAAVRELEQRRSDAEAKTAEAETQLEAARARRDELQAQLDAGTGDPAALKAELATIGTRVAEWTDQVLQRGEAEDAVARKLAVVLAERTPVAEVFDRLTATAASATAARDAARSAITEANERLSTTAPALVEDVYSTFTYDVHDWTRTCTAPVAATLTPKWKTALPTAKSFAPANQIGDRSHVGFAAAKLEPDPKVFATPDAELVARGDEETEDALIVWISAMADDYFHQRVGATGAALQRDPTGATSDLVGLFVGAQDRLDASTIEAFRAHVRALYGLQNLDLVLSSPAR